MIRFEDVTKRFEDGTEALKNISVTIPTNQLTAIIGPSGCGKTTLMRMINRLEEPTTGAIYIDEKPITAQDETELRRSIGYVIQRIGLIPHMPIEENIALVPEMLGWEKEKIEVRVDELMEMVELDPAIFRKRYPFELSGGQQQRIGVARALAGNPNIILMDEPFSALDPISREQLQEELKKLQKRIQKTIIFVTHDMDEALEIADQILIMRNGQIEQMATPAELIAYQSTAFVREFIGEARIAKRQKFGQRRLVEFSEFFDKAPKGDVCRIDRGATVQEAVDFLDGQSENELAVIEDGKIIGYVGYRALVNAALQGEGKGELYE